MKRRIGFDKTDAALAVVRAASDAGQLRKFVEDLRVCPLESGKPSCFTFDSAAKFINIVQDLQGDLSYKIAAVRDDAKEAFIRQANSSLTHRSAAAFVASCEILFVEGFAGLVYAVDDIAFKCTVHFFAQRICGTRGRQQRRGR